MVNRDLLAEAIADAKAVKETAIANAKAALEEAFTPFLKEKLAAKLAEMDNMEEEEIKEADDKEGYEGQMGKKKLGTKMTEADDAEGYEGQMGKKHLGTKEVDEAEEMNLDELLKELDELEENINLTDFPDEEGEHGNVAAKNVNEDARTDAEEEGYLDGMKDEKEDEEDEEIDLENMTEDDLKSFIESVIADMVEAGELEAGEGMEGEEEIESEETEEEEITERKKEGYDDREDESVSARRGKEAGKKQSFKARRDDSYGKFGKRDAEAAGKVSGPGKNKINKENYNMEEEIDEIVGSGTDFAQLADMLGVSLDAAKYLVTAGGLAVPAILAAIKVGGDKAIQFFKKMATKKSMAEGEEMEEMKTELDEAYKTISTIKEELAEVNLFNAKLLYTNKIFKAKNLSEAQKVKVLAAFDKAASVKEAELVFETLSEGMTAKKAPMNESLIHGGASKAAGVATKKPIMEANDQVARWQKLAGIK
jgi:hypothetical protein